ncbi:hypothetical protein RND71_000063 [Anisodus tanguticus]|uniref:fructose-bisphosphate aldolase n=1 Tax=Anisodus tanguticus TaxID=243964 RepID=A0AAE1T0N6_9SOLA|nr:hypothetical protein RND71_000063 [Anisodus tanguticus]
MASASLLKSSPTVLDKSEFVTGQSLRQSFVSVVRCHPPMRLLLLSVLPMPMSLLIPLSSLLVSFQGLVPLAGSNDESWCQGLDGLASRTAAYYQQGARFAKWRTVVCIPNGPSALVVKEAAWGLARYAAISQESGLVPIVEPEILLDGEHGIDRTFEVAQKVWAEVFFYLAENNVMFVGILLKPSMVTPGAECKDRATPQQVADYTLSLLQRRIPPAVPGIMAKVEATLNLNAMNQAPNPWHVSFSYARALQNTCLKTWGGQPENVKDAQDALLIRAKANSLAQLGKYTGEGESDEAKEGMFVEGYEITEANVVTAALSSLQSEMAEFLSDPLLEVYA